MADRQLELALRIKADLDQAIKALREVQGKIDDVGNAATRANGKVGAVDVTRNATRQVEQLTKAEAGIRKTRDSVTALEAAADKAGKSLGNAFQSLVKGNPAAATESLAGGASRLALASGAAGIAIGGVVAAIGLYGAAVYETYKEQQLFERSLITSGNAVGATAAELTAVRDRVGEVTSKYDDATKAVASLAGSGKIAGDTLAAAASAAVSLAELTGESIESTTAKIIALADAPTKQLQALNEQYNFLTFEVYEHVKSLEAQGQAEDAARIAVEEFARVHEQRVAEAMERAGLLEKAWTGIRMAISDAWQEIKNIGRDDKPFQLLEAQRKLAEADATRRKLIASGASGGAVQYVEKQQLELLEQVKQLTIEVGKESANAQAVTTKQQLESNAIAAEGRQSAALGQDKVLAKKKEEVQLERDLAALRAKGVTSVDGMSLADVEAKRRAQIEARYKERTSSVRSPRAGASRTIDPDASAQRELDNLQKQAALLDLVEDGEKRVTEEARVRYETENGAYQGASAALKQQLIAQAQVLDAKRAERQAEEDRRREVEKTTQSYERLHDQLRTPIEAAVETVIDQIKILNAALEVGAVKAENYQAELARIGNQAMQPLPDFSGELYQFGIGDPEADRMADMQAELQAQYEQRRAIINAALQQENADKAYWHDQSIQLEQQHQASLTNLAMAENQMRLTQAAGAFASMASIAKSFAGEQSKSYQVLFAISKGFAVAQAAVALAQNVAEASKVGFPQNIGLIAAAFAQGAQIAQLLSSAQYSPQGYATGGRISGPGTGTSDSILIRASNDEFMVRARSVRQPGALPFLDDFNARGMAAVYDWPRGFADGGLISAPEIYGAPSPRYKMSEGGGGQANIDNRLSVYMYSDLDQLRQAILNHPSTEQYVVATAGQNGGAIRATW